MDRKSTYKKEKMHLPTMRYLHGYNLKKEENRKYCKDCGDAGTLVKCW
jgi:hypothetical protein